MRKIKFRAWDKKNNRMLHNVGFYDTDVGRFYKVESGMVGGGDEYLDCILMQFTGLKDNNGKEIYEGDLLCAKLLLKELKIRKKKSIYVTEVTWSDEMDYAGFNISTDEIKCTEDVIVGNIYENKELLV